MNNKTKISGSVVDAQVARLLLLVQTYKDEHCEAVITKARLDAKALIQQAHHDVRTRMHQVVKNNREEIQQKINQAKAKKQIADKQIQYQHDQRLLNVTLDKLQQRLISRWHITEQRQAWVDKVLSVAYKVLLINVWQVEHPIEWSVEEKKQMCEHISKQTGQSPALIGKRDIQAGIRISSNGSVVDGTLSGLMVDRTGIEVEFLSLYRAYLTRPDELKLHIRKKDNSNEYRHNNLD